MCFKDLLLGPAASGLEFSSDRKVISPVKRGRFTIASSFNGELLVCRTPRFLPEVLLENDEVDLIDAELGEARIRGTRSVTALGILDSILI